MAFKRTTGFDYYKVLPGQDYFNPKFKTAAPGKTAGKAGSNRKALLQILLTESVEWIQQQDPNQPFFS